MNHRYIKQAKKDAAGSFERNGKNAFMGLWLYKHVIDEPVPERYLTIERSKSCSPINVSERLRLLKYRADDFKYKTLAKENNV